MNPSNCTKSEEAPPPQQPPVVSVPLHQHHQPPQGMQQNGPWSSGLCGCFEDISSCCLTFWCSCVTYGRISEIVDEGKTSCCANGALYMALSCLTGSGCLFSCFGCGCLLSCLNRTKMRGTFGLQESPCNDFCVHWCCEKCALCQEYRELQKRGFDMSIGWEGNTGRQINQGVAMAPSAPVVENGMIR